MTNPSSLVEVTGVILSVLGSLALFLFGMKTMSEALQKLTGEHLRKSFSTIASNKVKGFLSGFIVTGTIQSSTAVTIMLVSFVNASIFTLDQSLSVMIGANVGTTLTAWLITLLGFHSELSVILLPVMAFTLPLLFRKNKRYRSVAELITGFVLIFTGFYFLLDSMPALTSGSGFVASISGLSNNDFGTDILYALVGIILTVLIRSSSATTALTIVMCFDGWMTFENAAAMVIGANIGTTLTANLAAIVAVRSARRLALGHTIFNITGALLVFLLFGRFSHLIADFTEGIYGLSPYNDVTATPLALAAFHTAFNIVSALLAFSLFKPFRKLLEFLIPLKSNEDKRSDLRYLETGYLAMSEISLVQVQDDILQYGQHVREMFSMIPEYLSEKQEDQFNKIRKRLTKLEEKADTREVIITNYLTRLAVDELTVAASRKISSMLKIIDDIESIGDQCMQLERTIRLKNEAKAWLSPAVREEIIKIFRLTEEAIDNMNQNLSKEYTPGILVRASELELKINNARDHFINLNRKNVEEGQYSYSHGSFFADIANHCEKIGDHIINVNQAIASNLKSNN